MATSLTLNHYLPPSPAAAAAPSSFLRNPQSFPHSLASHKICLTSNKQNPFILSCHYSETISTTPTPLTNSFPDSEQNDEFKPNPPPAMTPPNGGSPPPLLKKRKRYRKEYPGESKGITEEMRFVAMKLRNEQGSRKFGGDFGPSDDHKVDSWEPSLDGFLKYLVDSKVVFDTIEGIVEDSNDVSYAYFRKTGLERSGNLARDLEWFSQQNMVIPEPSNAGISYAAYLKELSEKSAPLFLCHFYNVYFSHIAGGQVIAKQVSDKLLEGRVLGFYRWDEDAEKLLKAVREKLNRLGEHWPRDDKNKCLKEATKSFRYLGQIVRLIIL